MSQSLAGQTAGTGPPVGGSAGRSGRFRLAAAGGGSPPAVGADRHNGRVATIVLLLATLTSGLAAGVYLFYAHTVMPGLGRTNDRTFVAGFQALDRAIVNPWFMATAFLGAPILTVAAALLHFGEP